MTRKRTARFYVSLLLFAGSVLTLAALVSCGGMSNSPSSQSGMVTTSITDPPTCAFPNGAYAHVWVTITKVRAHISSDAGPNDSGWVDLVNLGNNPKQIDLFSMVSTTCLLTQLGSTTGLPPGTYQQIRILLADNAASGLTVSPQNNCSASNTAGPFNCVVLASSPNSPQTLLLSSEAQTGIKIPPGQIAGGGIKLTAGQAADLVIDFNACDSIVAQGNGGFRLKPTLRAEEVSTTNKAISGRVVVQGTTTPISGAIVFLEQPDANNIDRVVGQQVTAGDGTFIFCPLPDGSSFDVVVGAMAGGTTYNTTVTLQVAQGTAMGDIPLTAEAAPSTPGTIEGQITTTKATGTPAAADVTSANVHLAAIQPISVTGSSVVGVTVALFASTPSPPNVATMTAPTVTFTGSSSTCPAGTDCENYILSVPASKAEAGMFSASPPTAYGTVSGTAVNFWVNAEAFQPGSGSTTPDDCSPSSLPAMFDAASQVAVTAGTPVTHNISFTGCM